MYVQVTGDVEINKRIFNLIRALPDEIEYALMTEVNDVKEDSEAHTPVDTGLLKTTHPIYPYEVEGHIATATLGVKA